ncbi:MAG: hypothetical protein V1926_04100 [Candidatus Peregrinibacteria bacterium]
MKLSHHAEEPSFLQEEWSDIEGWEEQQAIRHMSALIQGRVSGLLRFAFGICQQPHVKPYLDRLGTIAATHVADISDHPETLVEEYAVDHVDDDPAVLSALIDLEQALTPQRQVPMKDGIRTKPTLRDFFDKRARLAA